VVAIRAERPGDAAAIRAVNAAAFETPAEANLVDLLRERAAPIVSLVATDGASICGHILFSPVTLAGGAGERLMGLAPMAVHPSRQREGIGSALVRAGLDACRRLGSDAVFVLGHAGYYPRFGFTPASRFGLKSEYDVADEVFMALELTPDALRGTGGTVRYHPAFADV
jgi:putative acetyltransferase